ncbi:MAG: hypothetical protein IPL18_15070 [Sphingomonadales bacterium]|nr:hypothetical protein [Sphingomonadales bacterium]
MIGDATWYGGDQAGSLPRYQAGKTALNDPALRLRRAGIERRAIHHRHGRRFVFGPGARQRACVVEAGLAEVERLCRFDDSASARRMETSCVESQRE